MNVIDEHVPHQNRLQLDFGFIYYLISERSMSRILHNSTASTAYIRKASMRGFTQVAFKRMW
jgi:hypothetical protein